MRLILSMATFRAFASLLLLAIIWGYNWVVMKKGLLYADPFQFTALRLGLGIIGLLAVILAIRRPLNLNIGHWWTVLVLGLLQTSGFTALLMWALVEGEAGKTSVLVFTMPFWVMLLACPFLHEKIRGWQWPAGVLSTLGIVLLFDPWHLSTTTLSTWLGLLSGFSWACSVIVAKRLHIRAPDMDLLALTFWQMLFGAIPVFVVVAVMPVPSIHWTPYFIGAVLYNGILCNSLAWLLWLYALQRLQAGLTTMTVMLIPLIGVTSAWWELGEVPSHTDFAGMLCIGLALFLLSFTTMRRNR